MGSKYCPAVCDIRLYKKNQEILQKFNVKNNILLYGRYRCDGFFKHQLTIFQNLLLIFTDRDVLLQTQVKNLKHQLDSFRGIV